MRTKTYWNRIRKKYPKAFDKLINAHETIKAWGEIDSPAIWGGYVDEEQWALRHLFDFFDSKKLNAYVYPSNQKDWHYAIVKNGRQLILSKKRYASRLLAEFAVWEKAFEILENKKIKNG
jgi:hypothetical protein